MGPIKRYNWEKNAKIARLLGNDEEKRERMRAISGKDVRVQKRKLTWIVESCLLIVILMYTPPENYCVRLAGKGNCDREFN